MWLHILLSGTPPPEAYGGQEDVVDGGSVGKSRTGLPEVLGLFVHPTYSTTPNHLGETVSGNAESLSTHPSKGLVAQRPPMTLVALGEGGVGLREEK